MYYWQSWSLEDLYGLRDDMNEGISMTDYRGDHERMERDYDEWNALGEYIEYLESEQ